MTAALTAATLALAGCVAVAEESATQLDEIGDVEVTTVVCASQAQEPACPLGNSSQPAGSGEFQLLVAYRVPVQVAPPESISARENPLTLSRSDSYSAELERVAPAGAGRRWAGYISPAFEFSALFGERSATLVARFGIGLSAAGGPFVGPFGWRTVVGFREADPDPARPVRCGEKPNEPGDDASTLCQDWPTPEELPEDLTLATRDVGVLSGSRGSAPRSGAGSMPFMVSYSGNEPGPALSLAAATSVPGGAAAPSIVSLTPSGSHAVPVTVTVPPTTEPGSYEVRLTASLANGQTRTGTGVITVTGSDPVDGAPPEIALRMRGSTRLSRARRYGVTVEVNCGEPCRLRGELRIGRVSARRLGLTPATRVLTIGLAHDRRLAGGRRNLRVRVAGRYLVALRRARRLGVTIRVVARDATGNAKAHNLRVTLRR